MPGRAGIEFRRVRATNMDLHRMIAELMQERERIVGIIKSLETMERRGNAAPSKRRGRKSMDQAARAEVAERMKRYWAGKREAAKGADSEGKSGPRAMSASASA